MFIHIKISRFCYRRDSKWICKRFRVQKLLLRDKILKSLWLKYSVSNGHNLYHAQYTRHVRDIIYLPWQNATCGKILQCNLEITAVEAGLSMPLFLSDIPVTWFNTTHSFVINTLHFCHDNDIKFNDKYTTYPKQRENDISIMESFYQHGYKTKDLKILNFWVVFNFIPLIEWIGTYKIWYQMVPGTFLIGGSKTKIHRLRKLSTQIAQTKVEIHRLAHRLCRLAHFSPLFGNS